MTVIQNGLICDGSGNASFPGTLIIDGDKIREVVPGACAVSSAEAQVIDATGCLVSPGFIDAHAHSDAYLVLEPSAPSKITQGITTEINGQCGGSIAPRYGEARLSSDWASLLGARLTWRSLAEYRTVLEQAQPAINTVQFVGHNTLRSSVVGYAGRPATAEELVRMESLLAQALDEGGWGLTTGLIYQPGKYATADEVTRLAAVTARRGGLYATHMKSEGDALLESLDEVIRLARETGIRAEISHLKTSGAANWHKLDAAIAKIEQGLSEGVLLGADRYPYCAAGTDLDVVFPDWAGEGAAVAEMKRLADPPTRQKIVDALNHDTRDWSTVMIGGVWCAENQIYSGRTVADILHTTSDFSSPGDLVCTLLARDACRTGAFFFTMSEANLDRILALPWIVPGSDASLRAPWGPLGADHPHPRAYGTMPQFYRKLRTLGVTREAAVRRMTALPAERFGIAQRGRLAKGYFADVLVWHEDAFQSPATYSQPHQFAAGIEAVWVNGALTLQHGRLTDTRAGRFLTRTHA